MSPPVLPVAAPPATVMSPLRDVVPVADPVEKDIAPEEPLVAAPELNASSPDTPFVPAPIDLMTNDPLDLAVPDPVLIDIDPPVKSVLMPASEIIAPPLSPVAAPTEKRMYPEVPPTDAPVFN